MDQNLLPDIFAFLAKHRPDWGMPDIIFLGGSQVTDGGIHKAQDSDYDILVLFPRVDCAESYSFQSDDGVRSYDLILRDTSTLSYDVITSQNNGRGTLLHLIAHGLPIYDSRQLAKPLQTVIKNIYYKGPHIIDVNNAQEELYALQSNLFNIPMGDAFPAALAAICNRIALNALRFSGLWAATGKIGGRFLKHSMPQFSKSLHDVFVEAVKTHDEKKLLPFLDKHLPLMYFDFNSAGKNFAPPKIDFAYPHNPLDLGDATTAVRMNLNAIAEYLKSDNAIAQSAAITWAHLKLGTVTKPLTQERFHKKPEEYFVGLGKAISSIADVEAAHSLQFPTNALMVRRISMLFHKYPDFATAFDKALRGDATQIKCLSDTILSNLGPSPLPHLYRPSPKDMRTDPATVIPDYHNILSY
ncbi:MAG: hypothetical protein A3J37_06525 [Alphaproteobacteria bacterium RIFCSPHIGHO2_12_FULL_45_9]|nr:MAG: hypothetical protein A3J37_06525 [Alphaproteobacteria bacterium RIFCSPHIGHO2_12_FULL_45_9]